MPRCKVGLNAWAETRPPYRLGAAKRDSQKKGPLQERAEIQFFSEESWRRQVQYAALQHIYPIYLHNIGYKLNVYLLLCSVYGVTHVTVTALADVAIIAAFGMMPVPLRTVHVCPAGWVRMDTP